MLLVIHGGKATPETEPSSCSILGRDRPPLHGGRSHPLSQWSRLRTRVPEDPEPAVTVAEVGQGLLAPGQPMGLHAPEVVPVIVDEVTNLLDATGPEPCDPETGVVVREVRDVVLRIRRNLVDQQVAVAEQRLHQMVRDLVTEGAAAGVLRKDVPPDELARYCLNALTAASDSRSKAAVRRLVTVTLAGLRPST